MKHTIIREVKTTVKQEVEVTLEESPFCPCIAVVVNGYYVLEILRDGTIRRLGSVSAEYTGLQVDADRKVIIV